MPKITFQKNPPFFSLSNLQQERKELEQELRKVNQTNPEKEGGRSLDPEVLDESEERATISRHNALAQILLDRLRGIKVSLKKAKHGSYGICDRCGGKIDPARLKAMPDAKYCYNCAKEVEEKVSAS